VLLATGAGILVLLAFLVLLPRLTGRRPLATAASRPALPDAPSAEEQTRLSALVAAQPGDPKPGRELGDFYLQGARPFGAIWAYSLALQARADDPSATLGMAQALETGLFRERAVERLRAILSREPGHPEAVPRLATLYLRTGRPKAALLLLQGPGAPFLSRPEGRVLEGRVWQALGDLDAAERAYRRAVEQDPQDAAAWRRLGLLALSQEKRAAALQALERAVALDPQNPGALVDLGRVLAASGKPADRQSATRFFRAAIQSRPYAPAFYHSSLMLARAGDLKQAEEGFRLAIKTDPQYPDAYLALANVLDATGRRAEGHHQRGIYFSIKDLRHDSMRQYLAMAKADPSRPDGLLMASQSLFNMMQRPRAADMARRAWTEFPGNPQARERLAASLIVAKWKAATQLCQEWLQKEPGAVPALWMLGRIAADEKRPADAIRYYEQVLAIQPENAEVLEALGAVLLGSPEPENLPRALDALSRAVALAPAKAKARYRLGMALMKSGRPEEALRQLLRSLDLDPHAGETYNVVVQLARRLRQPGAVAFFSPLVRDVEARLREELLLWRQTWDRPDDPNGYLALARFLIRTAALEKAESQLERALLLRPHWSEAADELRRVRRLLAATTDSV
jgi:tetratricopeptide (TPR) repeat protein